MTETAAPYKIYTTLEDLPLKVFIAVAVSGNLKDLVIEGEVPQDILSAQWSDLQQDYSEILGGAEARFNLNLYKDLERLRATRVQVLTIIELLVMYYAKPFADMLNTLLRTRFAFSVQDDEAYNKDIEACITRSKKLELDITLKEQAWEEMHKESEDGTPKVTKQYFQKALIALSNYSKFRLTDDISTYEYCERLKQLDDYIRTIKAQK